MNICMCGTEAGYQHTDDCPFPLYRADETRESEWREARDRLFEQQHGGEEYQIALARRCPCIAAEAPGLLDVVAREHQRAADESMWAEHLRHGY